MVTAAVLGIIGLIVTLLLLLAWLMEPMTNKKPYRRKRRDYK